MWVRVKVLVGMVRVRVDTWVLYYVHEGPQQDKSAKGVCVCLNMEADLYYRV